MIHSAFVIVGETASHETARALVGGAQETSMRLVKLDTPDGQLYINPEHVVAIVKGLRDTKIDTVSGVHVVKDPPEVVARLLGMEEIELDVTPGRLISRG